MNDQTVEERVEAWAREEAVRGGVEAGPRFEQYVVAMTQTMAGRGLALRLACRDLVDEIWVGVKQHWRLLAGVFVLVELCAIWWEYLR